MNASPGVTDALHQLAHLWGVETAYYDVTGRERRASSERLVQVLSLLGARLTDVEDAADALAERRAELAHRVLQPVTVLWGDEDGVPGGAVLLRLPTGIGGAIVADLEVDGGAAAGWSVQAADLPVVHREEEDPRWRGHLLDLPGALPCGYHRLQVESPAGPAEALVLVAPRRGFRGAGTRRDWGVFAPTYALHSERSWGAGDLGDLARLTTWAADRGASMVGTLPLLACFLDEPFDPSPYSPVSRRFWNELFLDMDAVPEFERSMGARALLQEDRFGRVVSDARAADLVDYRRVMGTKRRVLEILAQELRQAPKTRVEAFRAFLRRRPEVEEYARFRAAADHFRTGWPAWPAEARDGDLSGVPLREADVDYHRYVQWLMDEQITRLADEAEARDCALYLDLPLGVNGGGYDVWHDRHVFAIGASTGAPPDSLFTGGQDWGFPPLHPEAMRREGYAYLRASLAHQLGHAGMVRIDHVMGLHRLYWIPAGRPATEGVYVRYPVEELYAVFCLESHRHRCLLVGENLGTVPPEVGPVMAEHGIDGMYVLQYDARPDPAGPLGTILPGTVAGLNTHDMPSFAAYWTGAEIHDRVASGHLSADQLPAEERNRDVVRRGIAARLAQRAYFQGDAEDPRAALRACLALLAGSPADSVVVGLEDLWLERRPQNVPGTSFELPNWRRRLEPSMEQLESMPEVDELLALVARERRSAAAAVALVEPPARVAAPSRLSADDLYLFNEGSHLHLFEKLGAHAETVDGVEGTAFAVWAPNAERVSVVGDFNGWDPERDPMGAQGDSGIWEAFVPGVGKGRVYKYRILSHHQGYRADKADPFAFFAERAPATGSVVWDLEYEWHDEAWMAGRGERNAREAPISIYELHIGSWRRVPEEGDRPLTYREMAVPLADHLERLGFTHVEFLPVMEHPFYGSWGYQSTGYFAPTSRYGTPQDFMFLVDYLHQRGIGVIVDWVPSHFPTDAHALGYFDGTHLYEHADPRQGFHPDWGSFIFNYDRHEVRSFLLSSAFFWLERYHVDGLRVDAVASMLYLDYSRKEGEWIPNRYGGRENLGAIELLRRLNVEVYARHPDVQTYAEESTAWPMVSKPVYIGGLGFGLKWDMGWMHDTLAYFAYDPVYRRHHHHELTFRLLYAFTENFVLPLSHDEVVHGKGSLLGKMPGDEWQKFANLRLLYGYMFAQTGKKLLFMGAELAQWREWDHDSSLDWHLLEYAPHAGIERLVGDLNALYSAQPALHELDLDAAGFEWVDGGDTEQSVLTFLRRGRRAEDTILVACNFTPVPRLDYRVGVPTAGPWQEVLNTDANLYGGSGHGSTGAVQAQPGQCHGRPYCLTLTLPPLAVVFLRPS